MENENLYIKHLSIQNLWNRYKVEWELDPQVNILIGVNGSGKTTILKTIENTLIITNKNIDTYWHTSSLGSNLIKENISIAFRNGTKVSFGKSNIEPERLNRPQHKVNYAFINSFDIPLKEKKKTSTLKKSQLLADLEDIIYNANNEKSFVKYQLKQLSFLQRSEKINAEMIAKQTNLFYTIVNEFYKPTNKQIQFENQKLFFYSEGKQLELENLSAGEKQLLLIFLNVLLQEGESTILIMDEPEISLDIEWQHILIEKILELNPKCQIIMATHSPSMFGNGWGDKLVWMEDIVKPI